MRYLYVHGREVDAEAHRHVFFNDTATTEIYTLSLHDALPILASAILPERSLTIRSSTGVSWRHGPHHSAQKSTTTGMVRSEEHTSELQSRQYLVCRLLLEKKQPPEFCIFAVWRSTRQPIAGPR